MAVTFDAVGPSSSGEGSPTSPITWSHDCGASATLLIVAVAVSQTSADDDSYTLSATYGGVAMSAGSAQSSGFTGLTGDGGFIQTFFLFSPPAGSNTVSVSCTPADFNGLAGGSLSFDGAATLSEWFPNYDPSNTTSGSVQLTGTTTGNICCAFLCDGSGGEAWTAGTERYLIDHDSDSGAGNTTGATLASPGGTATLSWMMNNDIYGVLAVEVQAPVSTPAMPGRQFPSLTAVQVFRAGNPSGGHSY